MLGPALSTRKIGSLGQKQRRGGKLLEKNALERHHCNFEEYLRTLLVDDHEKQGENRGNPNLVVSVEARPLATQMREENMVDSTPPLMQKSRPAGRIAKQRCSGQAHDR